MAALSSVDLILDTDTDSLIRREWDALAQAGFSSLAAHTAPSNRPHVTLVAGSRLAIEPGTVDAGLPMAITIGAPVLFGGGDRRVLARLVTPSAVLLELQAAVHSSLGRDADDAHTRPGAWIGHVTLARRIALEDLPAALGLLGGDIAGQAVRLRLWNATVGSETPL